MHPTEPKAQEALPTGRVVVAESKHWLVEQDRARRIFFVRRSSEPFVTAEDMLGTTRVFGRLIDSVDASHWSILLDMRAAPFRNDPEFESAASRSRRQSLDRFARSAIVVGTAIGRLQVQRFRRTDGYPEDSVFLSEEDAVAYLSPGPRAPKR